MPLFLREKSSLKGRWRLETVQDMRSSSSNPVSCSETSIKIYGSKEEIRAQKSPETVDAPGFAPDASIPVTLYGMPDRIRTCDLVSRSHTRYPAAPRAHIYFFCDSRQIVVNDHPFFSLPFPQTQVRQRFASYLRWRYLKRRSLTLYPTELRAHIQLSAAVRLTITAYAIV